MKKYAYTSLFLALFTAANAQIDQSILRQTPSDTITSSMNMDAAYIRPSLKSSKIPRFYNMLGIYPYKPVIT